MSGAIWDRFTAVAKHRGYKPAVVDAVNDTSLSYGELADQASMLATELNDRPEGAIALIGEPNLKALPLVLACAASGRCIIPLSDREPPERLLQMLRRLPGKVLVSSEAGLPKLLETSVGRALGKTASQWQIVEGQVDPDSMLPFLVTHSSGSTGDPKAIAFSQETKLRRTKQSIDLFNVSENDTLLSPTPLSHSLGQRHFFMSLMTGATLVKAYPFNPNVWLKAARKYAVNFAIPVSTHLKILKSYFLEDPSILAGFRCIVTSSAPAEGEFKRAILEKADFDFWEIYGMSETACASAVRYRKGDDTVHLGQAVPGTKIRIGSGGAEGSGEIEVLSDCLCDGYWGEPDRWRNALTEDGYFRSGDLGRLDEAGNLLYLGRSNESFESGGLVIFPADVERVVAEIPGVSDCLAFGLPDEVFGSLVAVAYTAAGDCSDRDVVRHARMHLPKHMWPARIFRTQSFPFLSSGKVDRKKLVELLTSSP